MELDRESTLTPLPTAYTTPLRAFAALPLQVML